MIKKLFVTKVNANPTLRAIITVNIPHKIGKTLEFTNFLIQKQKASFILDKLNILFSLKFVLFIIIIIFTEIQKRQR